MQTALSRSGRSSTQAFWAVTLMLGVVLGGSAVVSPLYRVYQQRWHFSATTLTAVFGVYAVTVMAVLLVAGSLSDRVGRRPMIALALVAEAGAAVSFLAASGVGALYAGRVLQGVATGAAASAAGAAILDLAPPERPGLGATVNACGSSFSLAMGAMLAGLVVQYAPAPTRLVFWLLLAASLAGLVALAGVTDPVRRRPVGLTHLRPRAGVPVGTRLAFATALPALAATWALGGFAFSLAPTLTEQLASSNDVVWGAAAVSLLTGPAGVASYCARSVRPRAAMVGGSAVLAVGAAASLVAVVARSGSGLLAATALAGVGFGLAFLGAFRHLSALAPAEERGALVATIYVVSYLAFSVPVVVAGIAVTRIGLHDVAIAYAAVIAALAATAALAGAVQARVSAPSGT